MIQTKMGIDLKMSNSDDHNATQMIVVQGLKNKTL